MRLFIIRPRIRRGIDLLKEEKKKEKIKPKIKVKPKKKIKKKVRRIVTKKPEPVIDSIMDDFKLITDYDITDEQLELELKKLEKIKIKNNY